MSETGRLIAIGTGPGDPELLTVKAVNALRGADVLAFFAKKGNRSNARRIVAGYVRDGMKELPLLYPVTTELDRHCDAYREAIADFYKQSAQTIATELDRGNTVAVLSEGDPLFYGSYMHLHVRLAGSYPTSVIPGVTAMSGCWSLSGVPITQGDDVMTVLPGTMSEQALTVRLRETEAAVIMKVGRNLAKIRRALAASDTLARAIYVERGTMEEGFAIPLADKNDDAAPYFSLVLVPGWETRP